jgi:hypothetical protein
MGNLKTILNECKLNIFDEENMKIHPSYGTDKGHPKSYIDNFYEDFLKKYKNEKNIIVEIGVRSGASLKLWSEYFSKESKIYGLDNLVDKNEYSVPVNENWIDGKNIEYIIGDAYTEEIANNFNEITILIDDGPHSIESHIKLLELYSSKIKKGGAIIIEDIGYDPVGLLPFVKDELKEKFSFYDYGIHCDNKIILFQF